MNLNFFRRNNFTQDLADFESLLDAVLIPLPPRQGFVSDLGRQLRKRSPEFLPALRIEKNRRRILMVGGIVGSVVMLITSIGGILALIKRNNRNALGRKTAPAA